MPVTLYLFFSPFLFGCKTNFINELFVIKKFVQITFHNIDRAAHADVS